MRLSYVDNESGMSLAELIVALGLTSLLMILVVSGALFVKKYVGDWSNRDKVTEELAFLRDELAPKLESAVRVQMFRDSLFLGLSDRTTLRYRVTNGSLKKDGRQISRTGFTIGLCPDSTNPLPGDSMTNTLPSDSTVGAYSLAVAASDRYGNADTLRLFGRNMYESLKYQQD